MRKIKLLIVLIACFSMTACDPSPEPEESVPPEGPIGDVDGGTPEELGHMLLDSIKIWEEERGDVPWGSKWNVELIEVWNRPADDATQHHRLEIEGTFSVQDEPALAAEDNTPDGALTFYLTRALSLVGDNLSGAASGFLNFRADAHFETEEDWQTLTESSFSACEAAAFATGYKVGGSFDESDSWTFVFVLEDPGEGEDTLLECQGYFVTTETDKQTGEVTTSEGPYYPYTSLASEIAVFEIPQTTGSYQRGTNDPTEQKTLTQNCTENCTPLRCTQERILSECDNVTLAMQAVCSSLNSWMVEVVRSDREVPSNICATADCQDAIDANAQRGWDPFTSITYGDMLDCTGAPPAACEINCYGWQ